MTKKTFATVLLLLIIFFAFAQRKDSIPDFSKGNYVITNLQKDTIKERDRASYILRNLRNGSVIVRLKTNEKSIEAYRKSGKNNIADKIETDRKKQNQKIYYAFKNNFIFCKVYFIYANETEEFKRGNRHIFLDKNLQHDPSIVFTDTNFVFCEYGSVEAYSKFKDYQGPITGSAGSIYFDKKDNRILDTIPTKTSTSPTTTNGLFFSDKELNQLHRPFPYVEGVYMENYDVPVRTLNREIEKAYQRLVVSHDFKTEMKEYRKKEKLKKKESPKYNPFK